MKKREGRWAFWPLSWLSTELSALVQAEPCRQVPKRKDRLSRVSSVHSRDLTEVLAGQSCCWSCALHTGGGLSAPRSGSGSAGKEGLQSLWILALVNRLHRLEHVLFLLLPPRWGRTSPRPVNKQPYVQSFPQV